ncbi:armadillo-type protein [Pilobolus umbonatus]|nr:armadillo-type protein [Pilobolus umbonatus]
MLQSISNGVKVCTAPAETCPETPTITILENKLKSEDEEVAMEGVRLIIEMMHTMTTEDITHRLIPLMHDLSKQASEEMKQELSFQIRELSICLEENSYLLLPSLELLMSSNKENTRDVCVRSIANIVYTLSTKQITELIVPLITRLVNNRNEFIRGSILCQFPLVYPLSAKGDQQALLNLFTHLANDISTTVTSNVLRSYILLSGELTTTELVSFSLPWLRSLLGRMNEENHGLMTRCFLFLVETMPDIERKKYMLPFFLEALQNTLSLHNIYILSKFRQFMFRFNTPHAADDILPIFITHYSHSDDQIRAEVAKQMHTLIDYISVDTMIKHCIPILNALSSDKLASIRSRVPRALSNLCTSLSVEDIRKYLLPIIINLLRDEEASVQLHAISYTDSFMNVVDDSMLAECVVPVICSLATDKDYHIRALIACRMEEFMHYVANTSNQAQILHHCLLLLEDPVYFIREQSVYNLANMVAGYGSEWTNKNVICPIVELASHPHWSGRLSALRALTTVGESISSTITTIYILPAILDLHKDRVPNIRFNVALSLKRLTPTLSRRVYHNNVKPVLELLRRDKDVDVVYYAKSAMQEGLRLRP